jgi:uncharacterized protein YkwD
MSNPTSHGLTTRRRLLTAGALLLASGPVTRAMAATAPSWLAYERRLTARLVDAGGGEFRDDFAHGLLAETNGFRDGEGLRRLAWDEGLAACARAHAADMAARGYFAHASPEGFTHNDRVSLLHRDLCGPTAENLAWRDSPGQPVLPEHFQAMWERSAGHRRNLLDASFGEVGYGAVKVGGRMYAAGVYGDAAVRLRHALPLNVRRGAEVADAVADASPNIERLSLTAPFQQPTWMTSPTEALPPLPPGLWQLRPLRAAGASRYDVLPGPVFRVG